MPSSNNFKLNFVGIGAEKSGTTWIADCLAEHPEICMAPGKELYFFNEYDPHFLTVKNHRYDKWGFDWYKKQFNNCAARQIKGEFTPTYLYCKRAAARIKKHYPDIKIIVALRDPVDRAFSQYLHDQKIGLNKNLSFEAARKKHNSYIEKGKYYKYLKTYFELFPKKNILILFFKDIKNNPKQTIKNIYQFLDVKNINFQPPSLYKKSNTASRVKFAFLNNFMIRIEYFLMNKNLAKLHKILETSGIRNLALRLRNLNTAPISKHLLLKTHVKKNIRKNFQTDTQKLQKFLGKDLSAWLK